MAKFITKICKECAEFNHGKLPRKAAYLYVEALCDVCHQQKKVLSPSKYGLTKQLAFIIKTDRKDKHPLRHTVKPKTAHWLCEGCASKLGGTKNRIQCATWTDTKCDCCGEKKRCTEPRWFELEGGCI